MESRSKMYFQGRKKKKNPTKSAQIRGDGEKAKNSWKQWRGPESRMIIWKWKSSQHVEASGIWTVKLSADALWTWLSQMQLAVVGQERGTRAVR